MSQAQTNIAIINSTLKDTITSIIQALDIDPIKTQRLF